MSGRKVKQIRDEGIERIKSDSTVLVVIVAVYLLGSLLSSPIVNAKKYQKLMKVETESLQRI